MIRDFKGFSRLVEEDHCDMMGTTFGAYGLNGDYAQYYWIDPEKLIVNEQIAPTRKRISGIGNGRRKGCNFGDNISI